MSSIQPEDLTKVVMDYLNNYKEDIEDDVVETVDNVTKQAKDELKQLSREKFKLYGREKPYYQGWAVKLKESKSSRYTKVIWNKTNYQLTHLLEFGHATRNGGRTREFPHIRPVEDKYKVEFVDKLKSKIRRTSQ